MRRRRRPFIKVVGRLVPQSCTLLVHPEAQSAFALLRDNLPWRYELATSAGRPIIEVLPTENDYDGDLLVVGRFTDFTRLGQSPTDDVLLIPQLKTPEQIRDDAWTEVCAALLVPSLGHEDWARLYRRLRGAIPPASCARIFGSRQLTQEAFAAPLGIHPRTLARALKKHPAHPVGRPTMFEEALNEIAR